jgi:putative hemolysin
MTLATELLFILLLILANGLFAGAEIAIISVRKTRVRELCEEGRGSARALARLRETPESFFATVQIGITVVGATAAAFGGARVARALTPYFTHALGEQYAEDVALALIVAGISYLTVVFGELVPKSLALRAAERYGLLVARPLLVLSRVSRPLVWLLTATSNIVLRTFKDRTTFAESRLSKEELQQLVDEAATAGDLDPRAGEIAYRALDFGDVRVGSLMVPRPEMVVLHQEATRDQIREWLVRSGHSRVPVHRGVPEEVVGYVTSRDLIALLATDDERAIRDILREALFVPEVRLAADVLEDMQRTRDHLALVVDEQGSVVGLVTLEDLIEELVGEIFAEHETPVERIVREPDGGILVLGRVPVHEINRELGIELPESKTWLTIGGLVTALSGSLPRPGARLDAGHETTLEVVEASGHRVHRVRIRTSRAARKPSERP